MLIRGGDDQGVPRPTTVPCLWFDGKPSRTPSTVSFQIPCADQDEVDHSWHHLSEGGQQGTCGWLKDRFGLFRSGPMETGPSTWSTNSFRSPRRALSSTAPRPGSPV